MRSELFEFADSYISKSAALNPIFATEIGLDDHDAELPDYSLAHWAETVDHLRSSLATLAGIAPIDEADRIGKAVMVERLSAGLGREESGDTRRTFSVLTSPATE